jgi:hypothetical protein
MSAPLAAAKVAWRAAFDKLDIAEIGPGADGNPGPCRRGNLSPSVAVQAGTAGRYRWPVLLANTAGQYCRIVAIRCEGDCSFARCAYSPHRVAK